MQTALASRNFKTNLFFLQEAFVEWGDENHLVSPFYRDSYFSKSGAMAESRYVFLQQNRLPHAWLYRKHFHICETGFGTGLNFLLTLDCWRRFAPLKAHLFYTSIEKHPIPPEFLKKIHKAWPLLGVFSEKLLFSYPAQGSKAGKYLLSFPELRATLFLIFDDIAHLADSLEGSVHSWFLDGFSPAVNPEMWQEPLFSLMGKKTVPSGGFATFTSAGSVKRALQKQGFLVEKCKGFSGKRDMLRGFLPGQAHDQSP